ncbi:MAG: hypothetical protein FJ202_04225 [Gemmatimonadetes bacterium]|nr:hypothetical protein [Gemmatimonadota bacterium]
MQQPLQQPPLGGVPWQITGNHWLAVPCVHPADGAIHSVSILHRGARAALDFAGSEGFLDARGPALLRPFVRINGVEVLGAANAMAWERTFQWIPSFTSSSGDAVVRGTLFAPFGRDSDMSGAVYVLSVENRGPTPLAAALGVEGRIAHAQLRVQSARAMPSPWRATSAADAIIVLDGADVPGLAALAIAGEPGAHGATRDAGGYGIERELTIAAGARVDVAFYLAAGPERDGAVATADTMRRRGWKALLTSTRDALRALEQASGVDALDGLINRHLLYAYFLGVARALDDAQFYLVRSRAPWASRGTTIRDWEALMWTIPAVQLADPPLARELILRMCEVHGYAPGAGVNYFDGTLFAPGFTIEGAAAYAIAAERYVRESEDDRIVEEPILADTLYLASDDLAARRDATLPLYMSDVDLDGEAARGFSLHANAAAAFALECLGHLLDEEDAKQLEDPDAVRAAMRRQFATGDRSKAVFASHADSAGNPIDSADSAPMLWLPLLEAVERGDATFKRTAKAIPGETPRLEHRIARLLGPDAGAALDWLRRAPLDRGFAAEFVDDAGNATAGGGDAALSGLLAAVTWLAVHTHGVRPASPR